MKTTLHFALAAAALLIAAAIAPNQALAVNCAKNPSHPSCAGDGDSGNQQIPLSITFGDDTGDIITSDLGGSYDDGDPGGVEAFIGSSAKTGDILLRTGTSRTIGLNIAGATWVAGPNGPDCLPDPFVTVRGMEVDVSDGAGTPNGVYDLEPGDHVDVSMRFIIDDSSDNTWFVNFGRGNRHNCEIQPSSDVRVTETSEDVWEVTNDPQGQPIGCLEKNPPGAKNKNEWCGSYLMPFSLTATPLP